jgi:hypothetical protein
MSTETVTQADLDRAVQQLRLEIQTGDNRIIERFTDHLTNHKVEHDRIYGSLADITSEVKLTNATLMEMKLTTATNRGRDNTIDRIITPILFGIVMVLVAVATYWLGIR